MALRESGATNKPSSADSSRSRCQVLPRAKTAENASDSQITPAATMRPLAGPPKNDREAMITTSSAKKPLVITTSPVLSSIARSFWRMARA
jgi:hypothetical protein